MIFIIVIGEVIDMFYNNYFLLKHQYGILRVNI